MHFTNCFPQKKKKKKKKGAFQNGFQNNSLKSFFQLPKKIMKFSFKPLQKS